MCPSLEGRLGSVLTLLQQLLSQASVPHLHCSCLLP